MSDEKRRVTLTITDEEYDRLVERAKQRGLTINAVVRQDVADGEFLEEQSKQEGKKIILEDTEGDQEVVRFRW